MSTAAQVTCLPVGGMPKKSPSCVPRTVRRARTTPRRLPGKTELFVSALSVLPNKEESLYQRVYQKVDSTSRNGVLKGRLETSMSAGAVLWRELPPAYGYGH